jgi:UDP-2-acetamido-3-amino-2,3-dideoxy-glucuronate N-acetyltransferase
METIAIGAKPYFADGDAIAGDRAHIGAGTAVVLLPGLGRGSNRRAVLIGPERVAGTAGHRRNDPRIESNISPDEGVVLEDYVFCGCGTGLTDGHAPRSAFPGDTGAGSAAMRVLYKPSIGPNASTTAGEWASVRAVPARP